MKYRPLGNSGMQISAVAFGAWQIGDAAYWGENESANADAVVSAALDAGINFFDTAEMYGKGESERILGRALGSRRKDVYVASKVWPDRCRPSLIRAACEESLARLATDYLDLYQVHWPVRDVPFADIYAELTALRDQGKIRHIGISNFGAQDLEEWMAAGDCVSNQIGYNLLFRVAETEIIPACAKHGIGVLAYMPLMQGLLSGRWLSAEDVPLQRRRTRHFSSTREGTRHGERGCEEITNEALTDIRRIADELGKPMATVALAWLIAQPGVTSAIIGARNAAQLTANLDALSFELPADALRSLTTATNLLKEYFGTNADMWLAGAESRIR